MAKVQSLIGVSEGRPNDDFYSTPSHATKLLLDFESFPSPIWEPACGVGAISKVLLKHEYQVHSSDFMHRGYAEGGVDFFGVGSMPNGCKSIITNPPFSVRLRGKEYRVENWVQHGFNIGAEKIALFLKTTAVAGKQRSFIFEKHLTKLLQFRDRVSLTRNDVQMANGGMMDFAWFVFERTCKTSPIIAWLPPNNRLHSDAGESAPLQADFFIPAESTSQALSTPTQRR
jgi:hypothetical protein